MKYVSKENMAEILTGIAQKIGQGGSGVNPILIVTAPTGSTVECTNGSDTLTATESSGTWTFEIPRLGDWAVQVSKTVSGQGYSNIEVVKVDTVRIYELDTSFTKRYGYRIKKSESNPSTAVEYLYDAVGKAPARMNFSSGIFDYGDWGNIWFITNNRPCMLKNDGTVDYYLNPNDYSKKADGTASDVANDNYAGNAMSEIPLVWVKRYEDDEYIYEIVCPIQQDDSFKAYAHTRADGSISDVFYYSIFAGSGTTSKIRSLSGKVLPKLSASFATEVNACKANGSGWDTVSWSQYSLIRTLLTLIGKSTNSQAVFGYGNSNGSGNDSARLSTGTLNSKGQFYGYSTNSSQVKALHIEKLWGDEWDVITGYIIKGGKVYVKMTPEGNGYTDNDVNEYTDAGVSYSSTISEAYISRMKCSHLGLIPTHLSGSSSTYFCDATNINTGVLSVGGRVYGPPDTAGIYRTGYEYWASIPWFSCVRLAYLSTSAPV